ASEGDRQPNPLVILFPSAPNPTEGKCLIRFYIPESDPTASIRILNGDSTFNRDISLLGQTGINSAVLNVSDWKDGNYIYQLFYKGELRSSRSMVVKH
ncbi:MAG: hypothetical protein JWO06_2285, partial [Bacteroidota bacterium]|nr:hypothetical protein [Bacteroidota bacterium]